MIMYDNQFKYAGFWIRTLANTIDGIIVSIVIQMAVAPLGDAIFNNTKNYLIYTVSTVIIIGMAKGLFLLSEWQATPGKKALKLKVIKQDGRRLKKLEVAFFREISFSILTNIMFFVFLFSSDEFLSLMQVEEGNLENTKVFGEIIEQTIRIMLYYIIIAFVWFLPIVFTKEKTAVHDMIFGTRVIYAK